MNDQQLFNQVITPSFAQVKQLRSMLASLLNKLKVNETVVNNILLTVTEFMTNIVKHAKPQASFIELLVKHENDALHFVIKDNGGNFSELIHMKDKPQSLVFDESGMGLGIIFNLFPQCDYLQSGDSDNCGKVNVFNFCQPYHKASQNIFQIAVIDDEPMMREIVRSYLPNKYQIIMYEDGQQFLEDEQNRHFDLVISDISMPQVDGISLKKRLASTEALAHLPFIFLTAQNDYLLEKQANELGIENYLTKPINKEKLILAVDRALIRNQQLNNKVDNYISAALQPCIEDNIDQYNVSLKNSSPFTGGGDFVFQKKIKDKTLIILADVMGHDIQSKLFAHSFSGYFKGLLDNTDEIDLAKILASLSSEMFADPLLSNTFLTCIALELTDHHIKIVSAGHPCPLIFKQGSYQTINVTGQLAGLSLNSHYETVTINLNRGEKLFLYTDGLLDWMKEKQDQIIFLGDLSNIANTTQPHSLAAISDKFLAYFNTQCKTATDDMTFLLIEKNKK
mgnify:CR=1 FL=1